MICGGTVHNLYIESMAQPIKNVDLQPATIVVNVAVDTSPFRKLIRVIPYVQRFSHICKNSDSTQTIDRLLKTGNCTTHAT